MVDLQGFAYLQEAVQDDQDFAVFGAWFQPNREFRAML
jgi:hypothetical protein